VKPSRRPQAWQLYLAGGSLVTLLYWAVPPLKDSGPVINLLGLSGVVAVIIGLRRHRPASTLPWWFFALGLGLFWLGDLSTYSYPNLQHQDLPFPSIGDGMHLAVYPVLMAGLLMLVRRRNSEPDRAGLIDALIMTLGLALLEWVGLIAPYIHGDGMSLFARLVSIAYPLGDILLLAAAVRLIVDAGKRQPAFYLLSSSILALLVTDYVYGLLLLHNQYVNQLWLDIGWIAFYLLWGAAALHPSMRSLEQAAPDRQRRPMGFRLALLTVASLIAPAVLLIHEARGAGIDLLVVFETSIVLFGLVVARMTGLNRQQERSYARERVLSAAGAALVTAASREEIYAAAIDAACRLTDGGTEVRVCLSENGDARVVAGAPDTASWTIPPATATALLDASRQVDGGRPQLDDAASEDLRLPWAGGGLLVNALAWDGKTRGLVATSHRKSPSRDVRGALEALATYVSLALESAELTDEVLRRTSEAHLSSLVQHASDLITVVDADLTVLYQSPSIERVLGYSAEKIVGCRFSELLVPGEETRFLHLLGDGSDSPGREGEAIECSLRHKDGNPRQFEVLWTNLLHDEAVGGIVLNGRDVSERKAFEEQLAHQAFHDPVTNLANRALFVERVRHALTRTRRGDGAVAVVFLDVDDFKTINDSLGHAAGDQVLVEVARRLDASIRGSDTAARFGGDEFAVLLEDVESVQEAADAAERILEAFTEPLELDQKQLLLRASVGIAVADNPGTDADDLVRNADAAMYIAKRDGKGGYRLFEPAMHEAVLARLELRADLQRAIVNNELELYYQPVVRLEDRSVCGLEALLRWHHPERGIVLPNDFIPLAEETGLIIPIGRRVLREGCRKAKLMQDVIPLDPPLTMSINLSVKQLQHSDIVADVSDALEEAELDPSHLTLEITETVVMADTELAVQRLDELKALGVRLAMDDFGTGYSSLSYLSSFPIDILKMDRSFLRAGAAPEASGLANAVVALGETLELEVVAEGIERHEQWTTLRDLGCDHGQGFYFAKPMDIDAALEFLRTTTGLGSPPPIAGVAAHRPDAP
jgi:diguanylate cyclase (GGDEF)-like protein/PAS domain S-box-containing protein